MNQITATSYKSQAQQVVDGHNGVSIDTPSAWHV